QETEREGRRGPLVRAQTRRGAPGRRLDLGVTAQAEGPPTAFSIPYMRPFGCENQRCCAFSKPPSVLSFSVICPGRTGNLNFFAACGLTGRKPFLPNTSCDASDFMNWTNLFARSLFGLFFSTAIGSWMRSVCRGITYSTCVPLSVAAIASLS